MTPKTVQLIDAGTGNLQSVFNALKNLGAEIRMVTSSADCRKDIRTILPGVGAFRHFMQGLFNRELVDPVMRIVHSGIPLLGICVGMQAMLDTSEEMGETSGLGIIPGEVKRFPDQPGFKVPHTGWNEIVHDGKSPLLKNIPTGSFFYFNHSYYCQPVASKHTLASTDYILSYSSAIVNDNAFGVQFHPEKSQKLGQKLLQNFLDL